MKTNLTYSDDVLYVNVEGNLNKKGVSSLQKKMYSVISEYGIQDIVIDSRYGGNLKIMEK